MRVKSLVVIGNGFDMAHGIRSKYSDFHKYLTEYEYERKQSKKSLIYAENGNISENVRKHILLDKLQKYIPQEDLWSSFEKSLGYLDYEKLKKNCFDYLNRHKDRNRMYHTNHDFQYIIQKELNFTDDIDYQFQRWIDRLNKNVFSLPSILKILKECADSVGFLNFNYTDILERVYGVPRKNILYIHGKAGENRKLILGHHDDSLWRKEHFQQEEKFQETEADRIIGCYFRKTYKNTEALAVQNREFFSGLKDCGRVYVLGHSLSKVDFDYFLEIRRNSKSDCEWIISYDSKSDLEHAEKFVKSLDITNYYMIQI